MIFHELTKFDSPPKFVYNKIRKNKITSAPQRDITTFMIEQSTTTTIIYQGEYIQCQAQTAYN